MRRMDWKPNLASRLCAHHFEASCFYVNQGGQRFLTPTAVPTIFSFPAHLQRKPTTRKEHSKVGSKVSATTDQSDAQSFVHIDHDYICGVIVEVEEAHDVDDQVTCSDDTTVITTDDDQTTLVTDVHHSDISVTVDVHSPQISESQDCPNVAMIDDNSRVVLLDHNNFESVVSHEEDISETSVEHSYTVKESPRALKRKLCSAHDGLNTTKKKLKMKKLQEVCKKGV